MSSDFSIQPKREDVTFNQGSSHEEELMYGGEITCARKNSSMGMECEFFYPVIDEDEARR